MIGAPEARQTLGPKPVLSHVVSVVRAAHDERVFDLTTCIQLVEETPEQVILETALCEIVPNALFVFLGRELIKQVLRSAVEVGPVAHIIGEVLW